MQTTAHQTIFLFRNEVINGVSKICYVCKYCLRILYELDEFLLAIYFMKTLNKCNFLSLVEFHSFGINNKTLAISYCKIDMKTRLKSKLS